MNFAKYLRTLFLQNTTNGCFMSMFSFGLSSVIFKVSVADFEHVFVCWERYRTTIVVLRTLGMPYPAKIYSKSTTETLKQDLKSIKSQQ